MMMGIIQSVRTIFQQIEIHSVCYKFAKAACKVIGQRLAFGLPLGNGTQLKFLQNILKSVNWVFKISLWIEGPFF
jgi:hypothetical protein